MKFPQRFIEKIKISETGCWEWQGRIMHKGYGHYWEKGKQVRAHRYAYQFVNGNIPAGMLVCHKCDNRRCVNPDHLWTGTAKDNIYDAIKKGRFLSSLRLHTSQAGERNGNSKLTESDVRQIRHLAKAGEAMRSLAEKFGVSYQNIVAIVRRRSWTGIED